jgi:hypothetical protein
MPNSDLPAPTYEAGDLAGEKLDFGLQIYPALFNELRTVAGFVCLKL